jgi:hypothetical protein
VKFVKLLTVPAVLLATALMAVPVFANHATITKLTATCDQSHKICFDIEFTPSDIPDNATRTITVELFGEMKGSSTFTDTGIGHAITIDSSENNVKQTLQTCFDTSTIDVTKFSQFEVKVVPGPDIDLDDSDITKTTPFECPASTPTPTPTATATPTPTPTPSGGSGGGSPTPTASANTTVALAQTGGFDFRYPLIGLVLLVAGGALFVVSASRGRSSAAK